MLCCHNSVQSQQLNNLAIIFKFFGFCLGIGFMNLFVMPLQNASCWQNIGCLTAYIALPIMLTFFYTKLQKSIQLFYYKMLLSLLLILLLHCDHQTTFFCLLHAVLLHSSSNICAIMLFPACLRKF